MTSVASGNIGTSGTSDRSLKRFAEGLPGIDSTNLRAIWKEIADFGLFKLLQHDGSCGSDGVASNYTDKMIAFGEGCRDVGLALGVNSQLWTMQHLISAFGDDAQKARYLPPMIKGEWIGAFALTEADTGSDALSLTTRAEKTDGGYLLNGAKCYVGMGPICDIAIVFASTAPERGRWGLSAFVVHNDDDGFTRDGGTGKLGLKTIPMGQLSFKNCWIPSSRLIGLEGSGAAIIQKALDWERCFILASQVGTMARQLAECTEFAVNRQVFGQHIADFQSVANRLADMKVRLETCQLMLKRAADLYDTGQPLTQHAAMTNLYISEAYLSSSLDAMRTYGGTGYLAGSSASADLRDAAGGITYSGTSDIQRQIIAKMEIAKYPQTSNVVRARDDN